MLDDSTVDTFTRTGKLVLGILALIAEFETDIDGAPDGRLREDEG